MYVDTTDNRDNRIKHTTTPGWGGKVVSGVERIAWAIVILVIAGVFAVAVVGGPVYYLFVQVKDPIILTILFVFVAGGCAGGIALVSVIMLLVVRWMGRNNRDEAKAGNAVILETVREQGAINKQMMGMMIGYLSGRQQIGAGEAAPYRAQLNGQRHETWIGGFDPTQAEAQHDDGELLRFINPRTGQVEQIARQLVEDFLLMFPNVSRDSYWTHDKGQYRSAGEFISSLRNSPLHPKGNSYEWDENITWNQICDWYAEQTGRQLHSPTASAVRR